jgi:L-lysine exporter family protein LysE/ArgO
MNALKPHSLVASLTDETKPSRLATLLPLLAFTLLNPHTYIDTMLLLGSIGAQHPTHEHGFFMIGALLASFAWFFGLTYGASRLSRFFKNPRTWQFLETGIGILMFSIAYSLIASLD